MKKNKNILIRLLTIAFLACASFVMADASSFGLKVELEDGVCPVGSSTATLKLFMKNDAPITKMMVAVSLNELPFLENAVPAVPESIENLKKPGGDYVEKKYKANTKLVTFNYQFDCTNANQAIPASDGDFVVIGTIALTLDSESVNEEADYALDVTAGAISSNSWKIWNVEESKESDLPVDDIMVEDGVFSVRQLFSVDIADGECDGSEAFTSAPAVYTDENGDEYAAGGILTSVDTFKIWLNQAGERVDYDSEVYGNFSLSEDSQSIVWDAAFDRSVVKHDTLEFHVPYYAQSNDENEYEDRKDFVLTVTPVNQAPVVGNFSVSYAEEGVELMFNVIVTDPEGDTVSIPDESIEISVGGQESVTLAGTWYSDNNTWSFRSSEPVPFDYVTHTDDEYHTLIDSNPPYWVAAFSVAFTVEDDVEGEEKGTTDALLEATTGQWMWDKDQLPVEPETIGFTNEDDVYTDDDLTIEYSAGTDADGDTVYYSVRWFKDSVEVEDAHVETSELTATLEAGMTTKGETWYATVQAYSYPFGEDKDPVYSENVAQTGGITIKNSAPVITVTDTDLVIFRGQDPQQGDERKGEITFTLEDKDLDDGDQLVVSFSAASAKGTVTPVFSEDYTTLTLTYQVTDASTSEEDFGTDTFTFTVKDTDDDATEAVTVSVTYRDHIAPVVEDLVAPEEIDEVVIDDENPDAAVVATSFDISFTVVDENEIGNVGIASITFTVPEGWAVDPAEIILPEPEVSYAVTATVTTAGYATLDGAERLASDVFTITATITDVENGVTNQDIEVTVNDVDRVATAPVAIEYCNQDEEQVFHTADQVYATISGAVDPDGDAILYNAALWVEGEEEPVAEVEGAEDSEQVGFACEIGKELKKGQVVSIIAVAVSKPAYADAGDDPLESESYEQELGTVANTEPVICGNEESLIEWDGLVDANEDEDAPTFTVEFNKAPFEMEPVRRIGIAEDDIAAYYYDLDADEDYEADTVTITIDDAGLEGYATLDLEDNGDGTWTITVNRVKNVNTATLEPDAYPSFTITATDEDGATAQTEIKVSINAINTAPVIERGDIYVLPDERGAEKKETFTVSMGVCDNEDDEQELQDVAWEPVEEEGYEAIPAAYVTKCEIGEDGKSFVIGVTIPEDVELGTQYKIKVTVTDNGEDEEPNVNEGSTEILIVVGATPWYPIFEVECTSMDEDEPHGHQLVISSDTDSVSLIVESDMLLPVTYYEAGCKGLKPGEYTVVAHPWTIAGGVDRKVTCELAVDTITVTDYGKPGIGKVEYAGEDETESGYPEITVSVPLAQSYVLQLYRDGKKFNSAIAKDFTPDKESGLILPTETFKYVFSEPGIYTATVYGHNPLGDGEVSEEYELAEIEEAQETTVEWLDDDVDGFTPNGTIIAVDATAMSQSVKFSWPVASGASKYLLVVMNGSTGYYKEISLASNSSVVDFNFADPTLAFDKKLTFNWFVVAIGANGKEATSPAFDFSLVKNTTDVVVGSFLPTLDGEGNPTEALTIVGSGLEEGMKADVQVAHVMPNNRVEWYYCTKSQGNVAIVTANDDGSYTIDLSNAKGNKHELVSGDVVIIRFYNANGTLQEGYTTYTVK